MAPKYILNYFDARGVVEPVRYILAYKGVDYTDNRIKREDWPELKAKQPFGKLPTLVIDGFVLAESQAISRYVARELGLAGKDNLDSAKCDMLMDSLRDAWQPLRQAFAETDEAKKAEQAKTFFTELLPPYLVILEKFLKDNGGGGAYYVGKDITWVDLTFGYFLNEFREKCAPPFEKFPLISAHIDRIHNLPAIKAWVEKRPKTEN